MKRIVAKEFLLLIVCMVTVLLVALFGLARNAWLTNQILGAERESESQSNILDSLEKRAKPVRHLFVDLFDSAFVCNEHALLSESSDWHDDLDPLTDFSRVYVGTLVDVLVNSNYPTTDTVRKSASLPPRQGDLISLGRTVKSRFPGTYDDLSDALVGKKTKQRFPMPFAYIKDVRVNPLEELVENKRFTERAWTPPADAIALEASENDGYTTHVEEKDPAGLGYDVLSYDDKQGLKPWERYETRKHVPLQEAQDIALLRVGLRSKHYVGSSSLILDGDEADTTITQSVRIQLARVLMDSSSGYAEMKSAHIFLLNQHVLNCTFDALLYTLQRKPVPPTQETLDALAKQKATADELRKEENAARAGLWSPAKQWSVVKWAAIILLILVYPLRLLVLGTRWALLTLKA